MSPADPHSRAGQLLAFSRNLCRVEALLSRNSGERFNVFRILRIQRYETRTHTPMLRELLNPKGAHGQGAAFLELFLAECGLTEAEFQADGATVKEEHHLGPKTEESGGRLDLFLRDRRGKRLGIENKIDAADQANWVDRYKHYLGNGALIYLTLDGRTPSSSAPLPRGSVRCISYRDHITRWLEACRRHAATAPLVRETLTQYLHLIQELTHQNEDQSMSKELAQAALRGAEDLRAFYALCNARRTVDAEITTWLEEQLDELALKLNLKRSQQLNSFRQKFFGFSFTNSALDANNLAITFEFQDANGGGLAFGFTWQNDKEPKPYADDLRRLFEDRFGKPQDSTRWPAWNMWLGFDTWNDDTLPKIRFEEHFLHALGDQVAGLAGIAAQLFPQSA